MEVDVWQQAKKDTEELDVWEQAKRFEQGPRGLSLMADQWLETMPIDKETDEIFGLASSRGMSLEEATAEHNYNKQVRAYQEFYQKVKDQNKGKIGFWEAAFQDIAYKIPFSPIGALDQLDVFLATQRLKHNDYEERPYFSSLTTPEELAGTRRGGAWGDAALVKLPSWTPELQQEHDVKIVEQYLEKLAERQARGYSKLGWAGSVVSQMPAWMIEFALTGGLAKIHGKTAKEVLKSESKHRISKGLATMLAGNARRFTIGMPHRVAEPILRRLTEDPEKWASAVAMGWAEGYIEVLSEATGEMAAPGARAIIQKLPFGSKLLAGMESAWVTAAGGRTSLEFARKIGTKAGFNGVVAEIGEERLATVLHGMIGTEDFGAGPDAGPLARIMAGLKQDWENKWVEAGVFGAVGALQAGLGRMASGMAGPQAPEVPTEAEKAPPTEALPEAAEAQKAAQEQTPEDAQRALRIFQIYQETGDEAILEDLPPTAKIEITSEQVREALPKLLDTPEKRAEFKKNAITAMGAVELGEFEHQELAAELLAYQKQWGDVDPLPEGILRYAGLAQKAAPAEAERGKEPWEMTKAEFTDSTYWQDNPTYYRASRAIEKKKKPALTKKGQLTPATVANLAKAQEAGWSAAHKEYIQNALKEGKPVPREVLEEYKSEQWAQEAPKKAEKPATRIISKEAYDKARKRLTDRNTLTMGVDPQGFVDLATIGAYHIESGLRNFAAWSKKMIAEFGDKIKPHLERIWKDANAMVAPPEVEALRTKPPAQKEPPAPPTEIDLTEEPPGEPTEKFGESFMRRVTRRATEGLKQGKEYGTPSSLLKMVTQIRDKLKAALQLSKQERRKIEKEKHTFLKQRTFLAAKWAKSEEAQAMAPAERMAAKKRFFAGSREFTAAEVEEWLKSEDAQNMSPNQRMAIATKMLKGTQYTRRRWQPIDIDQDSRNLLHQYIEDFGLGILTQINTSEALEDLLDGNYLTNGQAALLAEVFPELGPVAYKHRAPHSKTLAIFSSGLGVFKMVKAAIDISLLGRQAFPLLTARPTMIPRATWESLKLFFRAESAKYAIALHGEMKSEPVWARAKKYGLALIEATELAEEFPTKWAGKIPGIARSERAFIEVGNLLRLAAFDMIEQAYIEQGNPLSEEQLKALAAAINDLSGRAGMPRRLQNLSLFLSKLVWSPRLMIARFRAPARMFSRTPAARNLAIQAFTRMTGLVTVLCLLAKWAHERDDDIDGELNPLSTNFGKITYKNQKIDITGGYAPLIRTVARVTTGLTKTGAGEIAEKSRLETLKQWGRAKSAPAVGIARKAITRKDWLGRPAYRPPDGTVADWMTELGIPDAAQIIAREFYDELVPLPITDVADALVIDGVMGGIVAAPLAFGGVGTMTYEPWATTELKIEQNRIAQQVYNKQWDELGPTAQKKLAKRDTIVEKQLAADIEELYQKDEHEIDKVRYQIYRKMPKSVRDELDSIGVAISAPSRKSGDWTMNDKRYEYFVNESTERIKQAFVTEFRSPSWKYLTLDGKQKRARAIMTAEKEKARNKTKFRADRGQL